ncbi:glutathione peroxidase [Rhodohalobacter sp. WB101]|uniref:Glutathione peroxidase n=2 Tax=Rhodohalobacter sulfatireducens TaxID=2911366 RepID=A0ABS9K8K6_9BACT|nr:glutathione peroxidase [Rhodohalobacter sulfatireducens]MDR9367158.1 glutathione peroxidase [Balneolaceae bacterium]MDR9408636.1 glutathione peroxidase [Balneolaceae bacterium]
MTTNERVETVYQYELNTINGENISLSDYEGELLLIVNTASECGFTPQYEGLQELYETYSDQGLEILGFPANNFGGQEPGSDEEIAQFCELNYGVTFPMFSKVSVKGEDQHPLFEYLTTAENPDFKGEISWNFEKFLIDRNGNVVRRFKSRVEPMSGELTNAVTEYL